MGLWVLCKCWIFGIVCDEIWKKVKNSDGVTLFRKKNGKKERIFVVRFTHSLEIFDKL